LQAALLPARVIFWLLGAEAARDLHEKHNVPGLILGNVRDYP
jgi:hypothetical protein